MEHIGYLASFPTQDYVSFLLSLPNVPPLSILTFFLLSLMRIAPIAAVAPFLGARLPSPVKVGITLMFSAILLPYLISKATLPALTFNFLFSLYCIKELFIGFILLFLVSIPFYIAQSAGIFIDFLRGSSALQVTDPFMQAQSSPIGQLYHYVFIVIFYEIGGPFLFLESLLNSYTLLPADHFISPTFFTFQQPLGKFLISLLTKFLAIAIQLASPSLVAILMAEMFLGIVNRLATQIQIAFLGMPIKSLLGITLIWAGWHFILKQVAQQALLWIKSFQYLIPSLA